MYFLRILAGSVFIILGVLVLYRGVRICRGKGIGEGFIDLITGLGFVLIGLLILTGYIS
jgi:hypothetical protein